MCKIVIEKWPYGFDAPFCLNFDDFSPYKLLRYDFGADPDKGINQIQNRIVKTSNVKITHFVVPKFNFWLPFHKVGELLSIPTNLFRLDHRRNKNWLKYIKDLQSSERIEIACHGYQHFNNNLLYKKQIEFMNTDYDQTLEKLKKANEIFENSGIQVRGFRQPGWGFKVDQNLFKALHEIKNIEYIASSSLDGGLNQFSSKVNNHVPEYYMEFLNIPQNIVLSDPFYEITEFIELALQENNIISLKGHYCNVHWIPNSFNKKTINNLFKVIEYLRDKNIWYATFHDVSQYFKVISQVKTESAVCNDIRTLSYELPSFCPGFTLSIINNNKNKYEIIKAANIVNLRIDTEKNYKIIFQSEKSNVFIVNLPNLVNVP